MYVCTYLHVFTTLPDHGIAAQHTVRVSQSSLFFFCFSFCEDDFVADH